MPSFSASLFICDFGHEQSLRRAESAEGRAGHVVGVHAVHIRFYIGDEIRSRGCDGGIAKHFIGCVHVRAAVADQFIFDGDEFAIFCRAPFCVDDRLHVVCHAR